MFRAKVYKPILAANDKAGAPRRPFVSIRLLYSFLLDLPYQDALWVKPKA